MLARALVCRCGDYRRLGGILVIFVNIDARLRGSRSALSERGLSGLLCMFSPRDGAGESGGPQQLRRISGVKGVPLA